MDIPTIIVNSDRFRVPNDPNLALSRLFTTTNSGAAIWDDTMRESVSECPRIKCVLVGDDGVGKTSLSITYTRNQFPTEYVPDMLSFERYAECHTVDGTQVLIHLWDMGWGEAIDERLLPLSYARTDVFVLCFSIVDPESYESVRTRWAPELAHYSPNTPMLVVGTKLDLREDSSTVDRLHDGYVIGIKSGASAWTNKAPIQYDQGVAMSKDIGANGYLECSALKGLGVKTVFEHAMRLALQSPSGLQRFRKKPNRKECIIL